MVATLAKVGRSRSAGLSVKQPWGATIRSPVEGNKSWHYDWDIIIL